MRHLYLFIHLVRQSQFRQGVVLDNQLSLLQPGYGLFYFLIIAPRHSKKVFSTLSAMVCSFMMSGYCALA